mmetsp:Transcript_64958/g.190583  ORF Transcript_64958/g.190583 Transcript_64958/m.190583 type:complete len:206 (+) Transcript_64958:423-1040(+)
MRSPWDVYCAPRASCSFRRISTSSEAESRCARSTASRRSARAFCVSGTAFSSLLAFFSASSSLAWLMAVAWSACRSRMSPLARFCTACSRSLTRSAKWSSTDGPDCWLASRARTSPASLTCAALTPSRSRAPCAAAPAAPATEASSASSRSAKPSTLPRRSSTAACAPSRDLTSWMSFACVTFCASRALMKRSCLSPESLQMPSR